jgi:hypothetical protein
MTTGIQHSRKRLRRQIQNRIFEKGEIRREMSDLQKQLSIKDMEIKQLRIMLEQLR